MAAMVPIEDAAHEATTREAQQLHACGWQGERERVCQLRCRGVGNPNEVSEDRDLVYRLHALN